MKIYGIIAVIFALLAGAGWMYHQGKVAVREQQLQKAAEEAKRQEEIVAKLQRESQKRDADYRDKLVQLGKIHDACLDTRLPQFLLDQLRQRPDPR